MRRGISRTWITRLNRIRRENRALHFYDNLRFTRSITTRFFSTAR